MGAGLFDFYRPARYNGDKTRCKEELAMLRLKARAKINWALDVCALREDGYHEVDLLLQSVDFGDEVELERRPAGISLACDLPGIPQDARNLAWRAAELMQRTFSREDGVAITLYKAVPAQAGLGGGSGDAAAVMVGLRKLWDLEIEEDVYKRQAKGLPQLRQALYAIMMKRRDVYKRQPLNYTDIEILENFWRGHSQSRHRRIAPQLLRRVEPAAGQRL